MRSQKSLKRVFALAAIAMVSGVSYKHLSNTPSDENVFDIPNDKTVSIDWVKNNTKNLYTKDQICLAHTIQTELEQYDNAYPFFWQKNKKQNALKNLIWFLEKQDVLKKVPLNTLGELYDYTVQQNEFMDQQIASLHENGTFLDPIFKLWWQKKFFDVLEETQSNLLIMQSILNWEKISLSQKQNALKAFALINIRIYGVKGLEDIEFVDKFDDPETNKRTLAYYTPNHETIVVKNSSIKEPFNAFSTMAHEVTHHIENMIIKNKHTIDFDNQEILKQVKNIALINRSMSADRNQNAHLATTWQNYKKSPSEKIAFMTGEAFFDMLVLPPEEIEKRKTIIQKQEVEITTQKENMTNFFNFNKRIQCSAIAEKPITIKLFPKIK